LNTLFIGKNFVELSVVDSTNTFAANLLESRPSDGTVVRAQAQTAGRGQQGSHWHVAPGSNLTFSLILYPHFLVARQIFLLNKLIACALRDTVATMLPASEVKIKWPNDLLVDRKKISGILIETNLERDRIGAAIIGIGLNVNQLAFEPELHGRATSMALQLGAALDVQTVLEHLLQRIEARYLGLRAGKSAQIEHDFLQHLFAYQEDTLVEIDGLQRMVHIVGVDGDGRLAVQEGGKLYFYGVKGIKFCL
jgi:BirA family transcriptional regulator, biotin operon repressor / biotin---[acetyl-CoA-carboxylase] ligase